MKININDRADRNGDKDAVTYRLKDGIKWTVSVHSQEGYNYVYMYMH